MSRNAKQANALKRDPGPSLLAKTMDVLYGTSSFGGNGSRARARKRVTLLLSSWIFESKMSIPYNVAARSEATAATFLTFHLEFAEPAVSSADSLMTPNLVK